MPIFANRFRRLTKERLKVYAKSRGCTKAQITKLLSAADDDESFERAVRQAKAVKAVRGFGDGTLLKTIRDWLASEQGQQFLRVLFTLLLGLLGELEPAEEETEDEG